MKPHVVIIAGGKGTRLKSRLCDLPKPLVRIANKPLLEHQIDLAKAYGFSNVTLLLGFGADKIRKHFGAGADWNVKINYVIEPAPRGTAGAVLDALKQLPERFLVMYGDTMLNVDLGRFYNAHARNAAQATLFLHPNNHPADSDLVDVDEQGYITAFYPYPHDPRRYFPNLVNAALYVIEKSALEDYQQLNGILDFGKHVFPQMLLDEKKLYGYRSPEYIKDAGTPERLDQVKADYRTERIQHGSFAHLAPAVFLDRDGTLNVEKNYVRAADQLELLPHVAKAIRRLNRSKYRTPVITNQPVIARGDCSVGDLKEIHNKLETLLGQDGAYVDAIYYCPHHPDSGFPGEIAELKVVCSCRKPAPGMVEQAINDLRIDPGQSWLIGDTTVDVMTARRFGLRSILVRTGLAGEDGKYRIRPDFEFFDLNSSVDFIIDVFPEMFKQASNLVAKLAPGDRVVIGGSARSGKSTWASALRCAIEANNASAIVVPLDCWLQCATERKDNGVVGRFDIPGIQAFLSAVNKLTGAEDFVLPYYDRITRTKDTVGQTVSINDSDIIILEGVIALIDDDLHSQAALKLFVHSDETKRKEMFWKEYQARGLSEKEIDTLYWERQRDEAPLVQDSRRNADLELPGVNA